MVVWPRFHKDVLDNWRVFYTVTNDDVLVVVNLIGEKRQNKLFIEGEEFEL
jgi:hypothetical protein